MRSQPTPGHDRSIARDSWDTSGGSNSIRSFCTGNRLAIVVRAPKSTLDGELLTALQKLATAPESGESQPISIVSINGERIRAELNRRISPAFEQARRRDVIAWLQRELHIPVFLDLTGITREGHLAALDATVTLSFRDIRVSDFLSLLLEPAELRATVCHGILCVTTRGTADGYLELRV